VILQGTIHLTAAAIAQAAGVDDFWRKLLRKTNLEYIRKNKRRPPGGFDRGRTNDAPALAQADVGVAMNTGTMAAKEAGQIWSTSTATPTKLIEIVAIGKQLLITRGSLTTFSIANDVAKIFCHYPGDVRLDLSGAQQAQHHGLCIRLRAPSWPLLILQCGHSSLPLVPLALRGVQYKPVSAGQMLTRNLLIYGARRNHRPISGIWLI